jgi:hypothetical protein
MAISALLGLIVPFTILGAPPRARRQRRCGSADADYVSLDARALCLPTRAAIGIATGYIETH